MGTAADEYLRETYGGLFEPAKVNKATGAVPISVSGFNPEAVTATFINTGANPVYIWIDDTVSAANGILLGANGGFLSLNVKDDAMLPTENWYAVSPGGASTIAGLYELRSIAVGGKP